MTKLTASRFSSKNPNLKKIIDNMSTSQHGGNYGILLSGDPGVGKTSMMRQLSRLLGLEIMIMEAPHIVGEHIIQIPFIVYNPQDSENKNHQGAVQVTSKIEGDKIQASDFELVYSNSYLLQELKGKKKIQDKDYLKYVYKQSKNIIEVFEDMGGSQTEIPFDIQEARAMFKDILFVDEYFRAPSANIRNILRDILNRQVGSEKIPTTTYCIYASNMNDEGLQGTTSSHQVFDEIALDNPSKEDWFGWFANQHQDVDSSIINKFKEVIAGEHLSFQDEEHKIRTSPRRWEQFILYVSHSLPAKSTQEANSLLANVRSNFTNTDEEHSPLLPKIYSAVTQLILDSNANINKEELETLKEPKNEDWVQHLQHQIEQAIKMGDKRKYVPVVAGAPGIGKNHLITKVAEDLGLGLIMRSATGITKDSVIGVPVLKKKPEKGEAVDFEFHTPSLLLGIQEEAKKIDADFKKKKIAFNKNAKYILYFDELDKVEDKDIFNVLRKVILEKEFANGETLPEGTVMLAAINPSGTEGSNKFTSHMADVVDVIHAKPSWAQLYKYLTTEYNIENEEVDATRYSITKPNSINLLSVFVNKFKAEGKNQQFSILDGDDKLYVSPRDMTNIVRGTAIDAYKAMEGAKRMAVKEPFTLEDMQDLEKHLKSKAEDIYERMLGNSFRHKQLDPSDFFQTLKRWFMTNQTDVLLEGLTTQIQQKTKIKPFEMYERLMNDPKFNPRKVSKADSQMVNSFVSYMSGLDITQFSQDLREFVDEHIKSSPKVEVPLKKEIHNYDNEKDGYIITDKKGLLKEMKDAFMPKPQSEGGWFADDLLVDWLENLMNHDDGVQEELSKYIDTYNEKMSDGDGVKFPEAPTNAEGVKGFVKEIFSDANEKTQGNHNTVSLRARKLREFLSQDKYVDTLGEKAEFYGEPLKTTKVHSKVAKFFSEGEDAPVEKFLERVKAILKDLGKPGHFNDALIENLEARLKELEDEYNMKHIKTHA